MAFLEFLIAGGLIAIGLFAYDWSNRPTWRWRTWLAVSIHLMLILLSGVYIFLKDAEEARVQQQVRDQRLSDSTSTVKRRTSDSLRWSKQFILVKSSLDTLTDALSRQGYRYKDGVIIPPSYIQKIEPGASGIQNNASNYGNQAGRDLYVNEEKILEANELTVFLKSVHDLHEKHAFRLVVMIHHSASTSQRLLRQLRTAIEKDGYMISDGQNYASEIKQPYQLYYDAGEEVLFVYVGAVKS